MKLFNPTPQEGTASSRTVREKKKLIGDYRCVTLKED